MGKEKDPQLEFPTNIARKVTGVKFLKGGENTYGPWYLYKCKFEGNPYTFFAKDALHSLIKDYPESATVVICLSEKKGDNGTYHQWEVNTGYTEQGPGAQAQPKPLPPLPDVNADPIKTNAVLFARCLAESLAIVNAYNNPVDDGFPESLSPVPDALKLTREDVRAIAITLFIQSQ